MPVGGPRAAQGLEAEVGCSETKLRTGFALLRWTPAVEPGLVQRVAVTITRGGLETGQFEASLELVPSADSLRFEFLEGQAIHFWTVITRHSDGWVPAAAQAFEGPTCVADIQTD
ncbi:MAG TPA: hypothetical protein QGF35_02985 [Dehalococcoidia bacterium]|nr:hypothetical protein [Dehalococcoidia bacterium]